ncbi:MAG: YicC family protein [Opitutaceae bacterium]|nr:YicC family protein [Opitutaceae bacterium]
MKSMTGFGRAEQSAEGVTVTVQVSSVNRKNLEVMCSLPKEFQRLERTVVEQTKKVVGRGRLQFSVDVRDTSGGSEGLPSDAQVEAGVARVKELALRHGGSAEIDSKTIVELMALLDPEPGSIPEEIVARLLPACVERALEELVAMRTSEGNALMSDLSSRCTKLVDTLESIKNLAPDMVYVHRENLVNRLKQADLEIELDDERVLKEIALFADRCDISEEITRLESHFTQFNDLLEKEGPVGRSLEFLVQEFAREINTTGSKSCSIEISKKILILKNELERIREQVANVE